MLYQNFITGWPAGGYCIFAGAGNSCPPGFGLVTTYLRAISLFAANAGYIVPKSFGASNIKCHSNCGTHGNWIGELNLSLCCK